MPSTTVNVSEFLLMGLILGLFALVGFRRGVHRELISLVGIGLGMLVANGLTSSLVPSVNRYYRMLQFARGGGLSAADPTAAWSATQSAPNLIRTTSQQQTLGMAIFLLVALAFIVVGQIWGARPRSLGLRLLGLLMGLINGFLVARFLTPILFAAPRALIALPSGEVQARLTDSQTIAFAILFFVGVIIALGLYSASGRNRGGQGGPSGPR
jgi:hypothetical protein